MAHRSARGFARHLLLDPNPDSLVFDTLVLWTNSIALTIAILAVLVAANR